MKKMIGFVLAALLLIGCSKPDEEPMQQSGRNSGVDDIAHSAPTNAPPQDANQATKKQPRSEGDEYMRSHTPKRPEGGLGVPKGMFK